MTTMNEIEELKRERDTALARERGLREALEAVGLYCEGRLEGWDAEMAGRWKQITKHKANDLHALAAFIRKRLAALPPVAVTTRCVLPELHSGPCQFNPVHPQSLVDLEIRPCPRGECELGGAHSGDCFPLAPTRDHRETDE